MKTIEDVKKQIFFIDLRLKILYDHKQYNKEFLSDKPYINTEILMFEEIKKSLINLITNYEQQ